MDATLSVLHKSHIYSTLNSKDLESKNKPANVLGRGDAGERQQPGKVRLCIKVEKCVDLQHTSLV